ncbi:unnamed protein product [Didymodactylos carnosus]|uniref:Uncharacterized protein n=1 Tax=Didymodactylos carnosus TaxID=1234261 RepID=A0A815CVT8_9BILA|nr:unnamed protein product [Didymodactylos carnosus]CAF4092798.1 unnamed protein product [Didymodactylos carnosus]
MSQLKFIVIPVVRVPAVHLVCASYNGERKHDKIKNTHENLNEQGFYDFIVVGSGPVMWQRVILMSNPGSTENNIGLRH